MKRCFLFAALMTALSTNGQSMDALLKSVEQNNAQLIAYKKAADATKSANHAEVVMDDLEWMTWNWVTTDCGVIPQR